MHLNATLSIALIAIHLNATRNNVLRWSDNYTILILIAMPLFGVSIMIRIYQCKCMSWSENVHTHINTKFRWDYYSNIHIITWSGIYMYIHAIHNWWVYFFSDNYMYAKYRLKRPYMVRDVSTKDEFHALY